VEDMESPSEGSSGEGHRGKTSVNMYVPRAYGGQREEKGLGKRKEVMIHSWLQ